MTDDPTVQEDQESEVGGIAVLTLASDKVNALDSEVLGEIASSSTLRRGSRGPGPGDDRRGPGLFGGAQRERGPGQREEPDRGAPRRPEYGARPACSGSRSRPSRPSTDRRSPAGASWRCACDKRLIADGARIGVTELRVGVSFPVLAVELLRHACGEPGGAADASTPPCSMPTRHCRRGLVHQVVAELSCRLRPSRSPSSWRELDARAYALAKASSRRRRTPGHRR